LGCDYLNNLKKDLNQINKHWVKALFSNRGFHALLVYRISNKLWKLKIPLLPLIMTRLIQILYGIDIDWRCTIKGGCLIVHGMGLVIGKGVIIGEHAKIYHGVTLGIKDNGKKTDGYPTIGNNVLVGCGAKILGDITIGNHVQIGANSVVIENVPNHSLAVGVPSRIIKQKLFKAL
jgi:serine O-acetyltransferase